MTMRSVLLLFAVVLIIGALIGNAYGQHAEHHDWYQSLRSNSGGSCCNAQTAEGEGDCRPASVWRDIEGRVWARISGRRILVPPPAVLPDRMNLKPLTGHICEAKGMIHCALVGGAGG